MVNRVFLLDLDGTIIGDISPQVMLWELCRICNSKLDNKVIQNVLRTSNIIRPGFKNLITYLQSVDCSVYVYTASEKTWANYIIGQIEKVLNIKFARPIFTRSDCNLKNKEYRKSTSFISKKLKKSLGNVGSVTIIDNNNVWIGDQQNLVICPTYNRRQFLPNLIHHPICLKRM